MFDDLDAVIDQINEIEGSGHADAGSKPDAPFTLSPKEEKPPAGDAKLGPQHCARRRESLTLEDFLSMQRELREGFSEPAFRERLLDLERRHGKGYEDRGGEEERRQLFLSVQATVLPRYGFEPSQAGVLDMLVMASRHNGHQEFDRSRQELNRLLGLEPRPGQGPARKPAGSEAQAPGKGKGKGARPWAAVQPNQEITALLSANVAGAVILPGHAQMPNGNPDEDM